MPSLDKMWLFWVQMLLWLLVTVIGGSFGAKLDLWFSSLYLLSVCFVLCEYIRKWFHISILIIANGCESGCSLRKLKSHVIHFTRTHSFWMWSLIQHNLALCDWLCCSFVYSQLASGIYSFAFSLWSHHTDCFLLQIYARDEAAALSSLERTLLSLKGNFSTHATEFSCKRLQVIHY